MLAGNSVGSTPHCFFCVALEKCFVHFTTNKTKRLIFKRNWVGNGLVGFFSDEGFGLFWREVGAKEIINQREIHGQLILLATAHGADRVAVGLHHPKARDVVPYVLVLRMEDMWAIHVHHDARVVALRKAIAGNMVAGVKHGGCMPGFSQLASHHST